ncbi:uncharacterized protein LOC129216849 [Uloborus diversus]|uniref:uncharacterized protein LOC129216849 n=1 Tax=Uloborus diversus TaxID=327109 RepID=UPI002409A886|nr:uncharacterized protein LOC129216849 [Uloborus diversus]
MKLKHIENIKSNLEKASASMLRILHYILFDTYGQDRTERLRVRTIRNILCFSGFPFEEDSEEFERKHVCLTRIFFPVLVEIQDAVIGKKSGMRCEIVENLLTFFMAPKRIASEEVPEYHENLAEPSYAELDRLKQHILKGPEPIVVLERLQGSEIDEMAQNVQSLSKESTSAFKYCKPHFIFDGPGITLKKLMKVRRSVFRARKEVISLLHVILYGRTEDLSEMRRNILEFNGFAEIQKEYAEIQPIILSCLTYTELQQICDVLSIYATGDSKKKRVKKILKFLNSPHQPPDFRSRLERRKRKMLLRKAKLDSANESASSKSKSQPTAAPKLRSDSAPSKWKGEVSSSTSEDATESKKGRDSSKPGKRDPSPESKEGDARPESSDTVTSTETAATESAGVATRSQSKSLPKLGDFGKIRENVECATPKDLLELNDLLLLNPSDETEIHQNILQSTQFTFAEDSLEFRARKVVLNYLPFETIKKVAQLLDIENCEKLSTKEELSTSILKFLTNMVQKRIEDKSQDSEISSTAYIHRLPSNSLKNSTLYTNIQPLYFSPTEMELEQFISRVVTSSQWSCKDEDLMELVWHQYPVMNLEEKVEFIKKKAKEILRQTKKRAFDSLAKEEDRWDEEEDEDAFIDIMT